MTEQTPDAFYGALAATYDDMTHFRRRLKGTRTFLAALLARHPARTAIDLATGTGVYAVGLAAQGVRCTGVDLASGMLDVARRNAVAAGVSPTWVCAPMSRFADVLQTPGDLLLCMGNSLPHLLTARDLAAALAECRRALQPGGCLVLQVLNYDAILRHRERLVSVDREGALEFVRFYDFLPGGRTVRFNVLTIRWENGAAAPSPHLASVRLRAWRAADLQAATAKAGFSDVRLYGGLDFRPWSEVTADTLLLTGR